MEWRCANCGRPTSDGDSPCEGCGHDEFERAVVRLRWECTACGTRNAERDTACRNCGLSEYVEVDPGDAPDGSGDATGASGDATTGGSETAGAPAGTGDAARGGETGDDRSADAAGDATGEADAAAGGDRAAGTTGDTADAPAGAAGDATDETPTDPGETAYTEWQCTECGTGHPRNAPPCRRCGNMQFEQVEVTAGDVGDYVPSSGWLDVELRYLAGIVLVVAVVVLAGLGVVPLPGDGPLASAAVDVDAVEAGIHDELAAERRAVGNDPTTVEPALSDAAAAHARALADEGRLSVAPRGETVADRVAATDVACASPSSAVAEVRNPGDAGDAADVARGLVDRWLDEDDYRSRLLDADVERSGVGVVVADGSLYVTWVGC